MTGPFVRWDARGGIGLLVAAVLLVLAGCSASAEDPGPADLVLVVPDNHIRAEGVECAGARPFRHVRPGAPFAVEADDGTVLVEGELPAGRAENADPSIDWGVERIPTICVMELHLPDLPEHPGYQLRLEQGSPLPFDADLVSAGEPVHLVVQ